MFTKKNDNMPRPDVTQIRRDIAAKSPQLSIPEQDIAVAEAYAKALKQGQQPTATAEKPRATVNMIDTDSAISQVNKQKDFLDQKFPSPGQVRVVDGQREIYSGGRFVPTAGQFPRRDEQRTARRQPQPEETGRATFTNEAGQEVQFSQRQLLDPKNKDFLQRQGFVMASSDFPVADDFSVQPLHEEISTLNDRIEDLSNDFLSYNVDNDPDFQVYARQIRDQYAKTRREMQQINKARAGAFRALGFRTGASQFAAPLQMGIEREELTQANQRIAEINREEVAALSDARNAFETGEWEQFNQRVNTLKELRDQKKGELNTYNQKIADFNSRLKEEKEFAFEQEKFALEVLKHEQSLAKKSDLVKLSPGQSLFDPSTGEVIGTAPEPADTGAPELATFNGRVHHWDPNAQSWQELGFEEMPGIPEQDMGAVASWANQIAQGKAKFSDIKDQDIRNKVVSAMDKMPPKKEDVRKIQKKIDGLEDILNHPGLDSSVGPNAMARTAVGDAFGNKSDFIAKVQRLLSEKALQSLIDAKAEGATFGALSDAELKILQEAATNIGSWVVKNKKGTVTGYNINEEKFKEEIERIKTDYMDAMRKAAGQEVAVTTMQQAIDDYYLQNPEQREYIDSLENTTNPETGQPYTETETIEILGIDFNLPLSTGEKGSVLELGNITAFGSPLWKHGLDIDLKKGDPVPSPVSGKVVFVGKSGGFGKQVRVRAENGETYWLSHLDGFSVKKGDKIAAGQTVGLGGNTGKTIPGVGGDGSHLDLTVKMPDGSFKSPRDIYNSLMV